MSEPSSTSDQPSSGPGREAFEQAVADCIYRLECGHEVDASWLQENYPQWAGKLSAFVADWGAVESYSSEIRSVGSGAIAAAASVPEMIGGYEVIEQIGCGGMGVIYRAKQPALARDVAIKMLHNTRHDRRRFQMEAEAAAKLDHPNIVSIFEIGEHEGCPFYTMPFIQGEDLAVILKRNKLRAKPAAAIAAGIADAVHYAHQRGILHRDLKPGNILIDGDRTPHVTDFGLAKRIEGTDQLTRTDAIIGTPSYMAPEQAMGKNVDVSVATDVYGVGAILYAMLTGKPPFGGNNSIDVLRQVVDASPRELEASVVTHDLKVICEKCLEKSPPGRYASAGELAADLNRFLAGQPIRARPAGRFRSTIRWVKRNTAIAVLGAAACLLLLFGLVALTLLLRSENRSRLLAEEGTRRERRLNEQIQISLDRENVARQRAESSLENALANYGYAAQQRNRPNEALLWFARAGLTSPLSRRDANRQRVAAWMNRVPRPVFANLREDLTRASFDRSSRWLLCRSEDHRSLGVFDLHTGESIPIDIAATPSHARWGSDEGTLWIGTERGEVYRLNCQSRSTEMITKLATKITTIDQSIDRERIAIGFDERVALFDLSTQSMSQRNVEFSDRVRDCQFCCDDSGIVVTCRNQRVYKRQAVEWMSDSPTLKKDVSLKVAFHLRYRGGISLEKRQAFVPTVFDDDKLAVLRIKRSNDQTWMDVYDLRINRKIQTCHLGGSYCNSIPNERDEVVNGGDLYARIRSLSGEPHAERIVHDQVITRCASTPDGNVVATADWRDVRLTERTEIEPLTQRPGDEKPSFAIIPHQRRVSDLCFSGDNRLLATVQFDGLVRVWDIAGSRPSKIEFDVEKRGNRAVFAADGQVGFAGVYYDTGLVGRYREFDVGSGQTRELVSELNGRLRDVAYAIDGRHFAMAVANRDGSSGRLLIHDRAGEEGDDSVVRVILKGVPRSIAAHPGKHRYAVHLADGETLVVDGDTGSVLGSCQVPHRVTSRLVNPTFDGMVRFTPDGSSLIQFGNSSSAGLHVFDLRDYRRRYPAFDNGGVLIQQIDISPDGRVVAVAGGRSNRVHLLDIETGGKAAEPLKHPSVVYSVNFSPDGSRIVTSCRDGQARILDWKTGRPVSRAMTHDRDVVKARFARGGDVVVTIARDKFAKVWEADSGRLACPPILVGDGMRYLESDWAAPQVLVSGRVARAVLIDLGRPEFPASTEMSEAYLLAELTAQASIVDTAAVRLTSPQWMERWSRYRKTDLFDWHHRQAFADGDANSP